MALYKSYIIIIVNLHHIAVYTESTF